MGNWTKNHDNEHQQRNAWWVAGKNGGELPDHSQNTAATQMDTKHKTKQSQCLFKPVQRSVKLSKSKAFSTLKCYKQLCKLHEKVVKHSLTKGSHIITDIII